MQDRSHLLTEQRLPESMNLDRMTPLEIVRLMNQQDAVAVAAVGAISENVALAVELIVTQFEKGGRLFYFGAGTSGRLGVLDASECPPTFRSDPEMVQGVIAGGEAAMFKAQEGAEDSSEGGAKQVVARGIGENDVVVGIAAGGTTPFVHGALNCAIALGAKTIFLSCVQPVANEPKVDIVLRPLTGPEVLTGSTRMKAGTATKLILNQLTTAAMVRMGKCYENLMVDVKASNKKLEDRAARIVMMITGVERSRAEELVQASSGEVKTAIMMHWQGTSAEEARKLLAVAGGRLRDAKR